MDDQHSAETTDILIVGAWHWRPHPRSNMSQAKHPFILSSSGAKRWLLKAQVSCCQRMHFAFLDQLEHFRRYRQGRTGPAEKIAHLLWHNQKWERAWLYMLLWEIWLCGLCNRETSVSSSIYFMRLTAVMIFVRLNAPGRWIWKMTRAKPYVTVTTTRGGQEFRGKGNGGCRRLLGRNLEDGFCNEHN